MPTDRDNPFVGPRPLEIGDGIYGRDEEIRELLWLFTAERVVWLHSPSGAGKTSMIQAGLIPKLEADDFEVLPTLHVNREVNGAGNRYEASVLSCLGAASSLRDFLAQGVKAKSRVLIFDQFEEILTLDSTDIEAKKAFFETIGMVLHSPDIWALFVIREDFLPALDPYVRAIPTLMNHRFRLDLLIIDLARKAMEQIARHGQREFSREASELLSAELARVLVQSAGPQAWKPGRFVEPVILQVVCRSMWGEMPPGDTMIEARHIPTGDRLAKSLASYYANSVKSVSRTPEQERAIRTWIGEQLIAGDLRNQVLDKSGDGYGLDAGMVAALVQTHLIRREDRGDRVWYELAHDRLVEPVRGDNRRWAEENLHWAQRRADLWRLQDRPKSVLLIDEDLKKAEQWIADLRPPLTTLEDEFLQESREEQKVRNRIRTRTKLAWTAACVATLLLLVATLFYLRDMTSNLIGLARSESRSDQPGCAAQDGVDALNRAQYLGVGLYSSAIEALSEVLQSGSAAYEVGGKKIVKLAFSPAKSLLAVAEENEATVYRVPSPEVLYRWTTEPGCAITRVGLSPDGARIAIGLNDGTVLNRTVASAAQIRCNPEHGVAIEALAFSKTGALASASSAGIRVDGRLISSLDTVAVAFDPDGTRLAAGLRDGTLRTLDLNGHETANFPYGKPVTGIAWGPGIVVAVSRYAGAVRVWDENGRLKWTEANDHPSGTVAVALTEDGSLMATLGLVDHQTKVWQFGSSKPPMILRIPPAHESALSDVVFLDNTNLLVADAGGAVRLFPLDTNGIKHRAMEFLRDHPCERVH